MDSRRSNAIKLLADLLKWPRFEVEQAFEYKRNYAQIRKRKRGDGYRIIHAPHPVLKRFQRRILDYFLYRIVIDEAIQGFRPQSSYVSNAHLHARNEIRYVLRLDFKDAFPSITTADLAPVLKKIFLSELSKFKERNRSNYRPLFPKRRVGWLRNFIGDSSDRQLRLFDDSWYDENIEILIDKFIKLLLSLTTHRGKLPQGASTSPYLLNIYVQYSGLFYKIQEILASKNIFLKDSHFKFAQCSIYADDITISSSYPIGHEVIGGLTELIEKNSCFKINRSKTRYYKMASTAPLVTGLRIARITVTGGEVGKLLSKLEDGRMWLSQSLGERRRLRKQAELENGRWTYVQARLPRKLIRKARGLIRQAGISGDPELRQRVNGYIANLKEIYLCDMPRQITKPLKKFLGIELLEPKSLPTSAPK